MPTMCVDLFHPLLPSLLHPIVLILFPQLALLPSCLGV